MEEQRCTGPIDDVVRELGLTRVDAINVDIEDAEVMVLRGAMQTLKRFQPKVVTEKVRLAWVSGFGTPCLLSSSQ